MNETIVQGIVMGAVCWIATVFFLFSNVPVPIMVWVCDVIFPGVALIEIFRKHGHID